MSIYDEYANVEGTRDRLVLKQVVEVPDKFGSLIFGIDGYLQMTPHSLIITWYGDIHHAMITSENVDAVIKILTHWRDTGHCVDPSEIDAHRAIIERYDIAL